MRTNPQPARTVGANACESIASLCAQNWPGKKLLAIGDEQTLAAAGAQVKAQLPSIAIHHLGMRVRPAKKLAEELALAATPYDVLVAIGSGTVNDLVKYAAFIAEKPYFTVATAASMNGYTSANASLEVEGFKQSFPARPPVAVIADTAILTAAPKRLTRAGIGDTLCRSTVEADMLMAHHLLGQPYPREIFDRLRAHESALLGGLMNARDDESGFITHLMTALLDAGDAMTEFGSSAVASQGEHMIAHTLELKYGSELHDMLHGELIALTTVTVSQFQQRMLLSMPSTRPMPYSAEQFVRLFGQQQAESIAQHYAQKLLTAEQCETINARLEKTWPGIVEAIKAITLAPNTLERALVHSGIHTQPAQIGLAEERYRFATSYAHLTRERFTFLDLAAMNAKRVR